MRCLCLTLLTTLVTILRASDSASPPEGHPNPLTAKAVVPAKGGADAQGQEEGYELKLTWKDLPDQVKLTIFNMLDIPSRVVFFNRVSKGTTAFYKGKLDEDQLAKIKKPRNPRSRYPGAKYVDALLEYGIHSATAYANDIGTQKAIEDYLYKPISWTEDAAMNHAKAAVGHCHLCRACHFCNLRSYRPEPKR